MQTRQLRKLVDRSLDSYRAAKKVCRREKLELKELSARLSALQEAQLLAQHVAQNVQTQAHRQISKLVTKCLQTVFDDMVSFHIDFQRKRGKTEAKLLFVDEDGDQLDPLTTCGGGLIDVAAFGLRLAAIALSKPKLRAILVLDEPFRFISVEYRPRVRQLLETLAKDMKVQILMVTHDQLLEAGKVIYIGR